MLPAYFRRLAACLFLFAALPALAQTAPKEEDEPFDDKAWKESPYVLPAAPRDVDLVPFYVSPLATLHFAIDAKSVSVTKDNVVRYTLVVSSDSGARNVSFEGIRCDERQVRLYAFGQKDGSWSKSRNANWNPIATNSLNRHHAVLATEYLCVDGLPVGTVAQIVDRVRKTGNVRGAQNPYSRAGVDTQY